MAALCVGSRCCRAVVQSVASDWKPKPSQDTLLSQSLGNPNLCWLLSNLRTHLFPIYCTDTCCLRQEGYSNPRSSVVTGSRSELSINFNFPLILPPETYRKTVFYSLLNVWLLFFPLNPLCAPYHLPKYLALKVLINTRNWKYSPTRGRNLN